jgi:hypothetical protein
MKQEIEESVIEKIRKRRDVGRKKYETTMEREDLTPMQWATHAQEEAMDLAIYLEKMMRILEQPPIGKPFQHDETIWKFSRGERESYDLWKWFQSDWTFHDNVGIETVWRMIAESK